MPSNQDRNIGIISGYNECGGMRYLADRIYPLLEQAGVKVGRFYPEVESKDATEYAALYKTFPLAREWLTQQAAAGCKTLLLHLHSDAGGGSHSAYVYSSKRPDSITLGKALAERCQKTLGTAKVIAFDYTDWLWDKLGGTHPAAYVEVCAHDVQSDQAALYSSVDNLASSLVAGIVAWSGGATNEVDTLRRQLAEAQGQLAQYKAAVAACKTALAGLP